SARTRRAGRTSGRNIPTWPTSGRTAGRSRMPRPMPPPPPGKRGISESRSRPPRAELAGRPTRSSSRTPAPPNPTGSWLWARRPTAAPRTLPASGSKPHELTQQFVVPGNLPPLNPTPQPKLYGHMAPWAPFDVADASGNPSGHTQAEVNAARIFRALDTFTVSDRTYRAFGGRTT